MSRSFVRIYCWENVANFIELANNFFVHSNFYHEKYFIRSYDDNLLSYKTNKILRIKELICNKLLLNAESVILKINLHLYVYRKKFICLEGI